MAGENILTREHLRSVLDEILEEKLEKKLAPLRGSIEFVAKEFEDFKTKIRKLEEANKESAGLKETVQKLSKRVEEYKTLVDNQEQYTRRDCLEIRGIPPTRGENTNEVVQRIGSLVNVTIQDSDISISHRLPSRERKGGSSTKPEAKYPSIIVKFTRRNVREAFYKARSKLKDYTTDDIGLGRFTVNGIYIQESLTERKKDLFGKCLQFKKDHHYKYIWTYYGKIFLRRNDTSPAVTVLSVADLDKLKSQGPRQAHDDSANE